jgi:hypothetical protein
MELSNQPKRIRIEATNQMASGLGVIDERFAELQDEYAS